MKKRINWKKVIIILSVAVIVGGGLFAHHTIERRKVEIEIEERRIQEAYIRVNVSFGMGFMTGFERERLIEQKELAFFLWDCMKIWSRYHAFYDDPWDGNKFDLHVTSYLPLRFYENRTGIYLPYEIVVDYFSQEFEPDGSLRLYNNGNHHEIEAFVGWFWNNLAEFDEFERKVRQLYIDYYNANENFERKGTILSLSPQMIDVLARAEADPHYVLDLTSLREQGY